MNMRTLAIAISTTAFATLTGCTAMHQVKAQSDAGYQQASGEIAPYTAQVRNPDRGHVSGPIISNVPYVSTVPIKHTVGYPPIFDEHVTVNQPQGQSIAELLSTISMLSGVTVSADSDVLDNAPQPLAAAPSGKHGDDSTLNLPPSIIGDGGGPQYVSSTIHYNGNLKGLLDQVGLAIGATWRYDALTNQVHFFRYETKVFTLATTPGDATNSATVGGNQQTMQGQQGQTLRVSGVDASTKFTGDLKIWSSVGDAIKTMLSSSGKVTLSPATGTIVVRDRYDRVAQIGKYIQQINGKLTLAVMVNITVYRVSVDNSDNRGIDWNIMYNTLGRLANRVGATIATPMVPITGSTSLVLNAPQVNAQGLPSLWAGSKFFLQALSSLGNTSVVTHASIDTTNNQPAPVKLVTNQSYLAETTSLYTNGVTGGNTGVVGAGATLTPGNIETGLTMQVLPSVQDDGKHMLLQLTFSDSVLNSIDQVSSGGNSIQLPNVSSKETMQRAWLQSGQTLVLAGFENDQNGTTTKTPFGAKTWLFGGNRNVTHAHDALVVVITPVVTDAASDALATDSPASP